LDSRARFLGVPFEGVYASVGVGVTTMLWTLIWLHQLRLSRNNTIHLLHELQNYLSRGFHVLPSPLQLRQKQAVTVTDILVLELHQIRVIVTEFEILAFRELAFCFMLC
jgi:hypothetical protein